MNNNLGHFIWYFLIFLVVGIIWGCEKVEKEKSENGKITTNKPILELIPTSKTGIGFSNDIPQDRNINILTFEYLNNGGGVSIGDINNDGLPDIYFTGNIVPNRLYLNKGGFQFQDITKKANVGGSRGWTTGTTMVDINNDGYLDIYVCLSGQVPPNQRRNMLFINNGDLTFTEKASQYGLADPGFGNQAAFFDYDNDGDLDMFLLNHNVVPMNRFNPYEVREQIDPHVGDKLYRNDNDKFVEVSQQAGIEQNPLGYGLGVSIGDLNNDGWPDIYVSNDFLEHEYLYFNNGDGTFSQKIQEAMPHISEFGMGNDIADYNNDGFLDVIVADMAAPDNYGKKTGMSSMNRTKFQAMVEDGFHYQYMFNTLQMNTGRNRFSEVGHLAGVSATDWSWAPLFFDMDNDGYKDLFMTNGYRKNQANKDYRMLEMERMEQFDNPGANPQQVQNLFRNLLDSIPPRKERNFVYKNNGDLTFEAKNQSWGIHNKSFSNGAAYGDLDNDGDLDLVINNIDTNAYIYQNKVREIYDRNFLKVKLKGSNKNVDGLGTRVTLNSEEELLQMQEHYLTRGFQSSVENTLHFGLGERETIPELKVQWPDGKIQHVENVNANQVVTLNYQNAGQPQEEKPQKDLLFTDYTQGSGITFTHRENEFNDYQVQPLMPHKMSRFGPALAVGDVNNDGMEDFFVGGARGQAGQIYLQNQNQKFESPGFNFLETDQAYEDLDAAFFDADGDADLDLYVVSGGNIRNPDDTLLQDRLYINQGSNDQGIPRFTKTEDAIPTMLTSGGIVTSCDFDGDNDLDLFVGGRFVPGNYPLPPTSYLLRNDNGTFTDVTDQLAPEIQNTGMVVSAHWVDLNNNKNKDLVIGGEWMPVKIFLHNGQKGNNAGFKEVSSASGMHNTQGWWFSLASGDFDQDGDTDLIGGNLGLNYRYEASPEHPFHIYYHDFDGNGQRDIVLGYYDQNKLYPLQGRETLAEKMPFIENQFPSFSSYGEATLQEVFGKQDLEDAFHLQVKTFASSYFENKGVNEDGVPQFSIKKLPNYAQISAINGIITNDFNGDGTRDILSAGNFYVSESETPRNDAGIGLFLQGNGQGDFNPMHTTRSGFYTPGDVKALQAIRLGKDSGYAILVAKNNGQLQIIKAAGIRDPDL